MLRTCVIGMGPIGNRHADMYREDPLAELVGVCDIIRQRADAAADRLGVPAFHDARAMLGALRPDVCSITTGGYEYGSDHYEPTMQALEAGCHVLGEKPISNEIPKAEEMVAMARERGLCYGINLNHRFTPAARVAKRWQDEGRLGHLLFINMSMWIMNPVESSPYFQIKALHPHTVDVMRHFCGDVEAVQCFATKAPGRKIWSTAQFNLRFVNGVVGSLTGSYDVERGHPMERCEVAGTRGRFVLEDMWREATLYPAGNLEKTVYTNPVFGGMRDFTDTFRNRIHRFLEQVAEGADPAAIDGSGADGLAVQRVLAAAIESLDNETVVYVK
jgi:predicted dehydrogenase